MKLEVLVSTMHQENYDLINKMNISTDAVVINQCNNSEYINLIKDNKKIKWYNSKDKGLSKSRNKAIELATEDLCILADDDLEYVKNYKDIIVDSFLQNKDADIIAFQIEGIEKKFKNYKSQKKWLGYVGSMKLSSVEVAFRLDSIKKNGICFNEYFGAGSRFYMGEENIFLFDCLKRGLKILYVPIKVADLHIQNSSWFNGFDKTYFINRGASFTAMSEKNFAIVNTTVCI